jgi:hypothetical protein
VAGETKETGLRPGHFLFVVAVAVVGVLVAFWVLSFLASFVWGLIKIAVLVALVAGVVWFILGRARRHGASSD